ncbi:MAG: DUF58 domain-containing protein [Gammaproteobacteria bacterium]|nr:DUF58 domain-containing protein [Gammaproteobacteria bacterium]
MLVLKELLALSGVMQRRVLRRLQAYRTAMPYRRPLKGKHLAGVTCSFAELLALRSDAAGLLLQTPLKAPQELNGNFLSAFRGQGMEYQESRHYQWGDDVRNMDWRVTAKTHKPHVKVFNQERERSVFFLVDHSNSMHFATRNEYKSVRASKVAALLAGLAVDLSDKVGGFIFDEQSHAELKPMSGDKGILPLLKKLAIEQAPVRMSQTVNAQDHASSADAVTSDDVLLDALRRLDHVAPRGSLVFVLSDFYALTDASPQYDRVLFNLARSAELVLVLIYDPFEMNTLPAGKYRLSDGVQILEMDDSPEETRDRQKQSFQQRLKRLDTLCHQMGMSGLCLSTEGELIPELQKVLQGYQGRSNFIYAGEEKHG